MRTVEFCTEQLREIIIDEHVENLLKLRTQSNGENNTSTREQGKKIR